MRTLTLKGFLRRYLKELSATSNLRLSHLVADLLAGNARLAEPLFWYATMNGDDDRLQSLLRGSGWERDYFRFREAFRDHPHDPSVLGVRYAKLYKSYLSVRDRRESEKRLKELMRKRLLKAVQSGDITMYRLCRTLDLNEGNLFAFLKQGNLNAMSLEKARAMVELVR